MKFYIFLFCAVCISESLSIPLQNSEIAKPRADDIDYRLPRTVNPEHYVITLEPEFVSFTFEGEVFVSFTALVDSDNLTLHTLDMTLKSVEMIDANQNAISINNVASDLTLEFFIIYLNDNLIAGESYTLHITYTGNLNELKKGFYRSSYEDIDGNVRWLAVTQFEPTDARRAFPCFDEPALKATFQVNLIRERTYNSISNSDLSETVQLDENRFKDIFTTTIKMSTYLMAFVVSDFTWTESVENKHRVFARPQYIANGDAEFALEMGVVALERMGEFMENSYFDHMPKMDQIGIPDKDFSAGAMENWGLVTYRETALLWNSETSPTSRKQGVVTIIAHEFGHQWFGDLVSPLWWNYIWLNEGFATYFTYHLSDLMQPTWKFKDQFIHGAIHVAFSTDGSRNTRPMTFDAGSPREISALFDNIAYAKSGSVIRMLEHIVTPSNFLAGLKLYLASLTYDSADSSMLWNAMQRTLPPVGDDGYVDVSQVMSSWELQSGMPVVTVSRSYETGDIALAQQRFLTNEATHNDSTEWFVPINYATSVDLAFVNTYPYEWLVPGENLNIAVGLQNLAPTDWIIINNQQTGYYRVNYDETNWLLLAEYLSNNNPNNVHTYNRAQLIDDSYYLALSGRLSYKIPLEISKYINQETEYLPLVEYFNFLNFINNKILGITNYNDFKRIVGTDLLTDVFNHFGASETPEDNHVDILIRSDVIKWSCYMDSDACKIATSGRIRAWIENPVANSISVDIQRELFCAGLRSDTDSTLWNDVYEKYLQLPSSNLKADILNGLGCAENVQQLNNFFEIALDETNPINNAFDVVYTKGKSNLDISFDYVLNNYERISETFSPITAKTILEKISTLLSSTEDISKMETFIAAHPEDNFQNSLNNVMINNQWIIDYGADIETWIQNNTN